jgi:hypothetical protein
VNCGLLPEVIVASPMLMSNMGLARSLLGSPDVDAVGFLQSSRGEGDQVKPSWRGLESCDTSYLFLVRLPE